MAAPALARANPVRHVLPSVRAVQLPVASFAPTVSSPRSVAVLPISPPIPSPASVVAVPVQPQPLPVDVGALLRAGPTWDGVTQLVSLQPELRPMQLALESLVRGARAPSTVLKYEHSMLRLSAFMIDNLRIDMQLPIPPAVLALWIVSLQQRGLAPSSLQGAVAAVAWAHRAAGFSSPTVDQVVRLALDGAVRANAAPVNRKQPFLPDQIVSMVTSLCSQPSLKSLRTAAMLCIAFGALLRLAELRDLRLGDVSVLSDHLLVSVRKSKTDQLRQGSVRLIPALPADVVCPRKVFQDYRSQLVAAYALPVTDEFPLWPSLSGGLQPRPLSTTVPMSADSARAELKKVCLDSGLDPSSFTWHSCRSGGATSAARHGVPEPLVQTLGAWKSDAVKRYVRWADDTLLGAATRVWHPIQPSAAQPIQSPAADGADLAAPHYPTSSDVESVSALSLDLFGHHPSPPPSPQPGLSLGLSNPPVYSWVTPVFPFAPHHVSQP